jgi:predicted small lipoprotein YifL
MKRLLAVACMALLTACGSGGPPPPDWKTDSADLIERYQKHALLGENILAERYFQQAVRATGGAGRINDTAKLWLVHCATRRAMLIDDPCTGYAQLARIEPNPANEAYFQFLTLHWDAVDTSLLPEQHQRLVKAPAPARPAMLVAIDDPLARLLDASLLVMRQEAGSDTLSLATATASDQGWRQPLLTYLKLQQTQAIAHGNAAESARLALRIQLVEQSFQPQP